MEFYCDLIIPAATHLRLFTVTLRVCGLLTVCLLPLPFACPAFVRYLSGLPPLPAHYLLPIPTV